MKGWRDEGVRKHCINLHLKLSDSQDSQCQDIDGTTLFEELKTLQCFIKKESSRQNALNYYTYMKIN